MAIERANIVAAARGWLGTPYAHQQARRGAGCDCLGLVRGVYAEIMGAPAEAPPPYTRDWAEVTGAETLAEAARRHLIEIDPADPAPGDVALFRMVRGAPAKHCGFIGCGPDGLTLIHAREPGPVHEEALGAAWRRRLAFAFRFPGVI